MVVVRIMQVNRFSFSSAFVFFQFFIAPGVIVSRNLGDIFGRQIMILKGILLFSIPTISEAYFANVSMLTVAFFFVGGFLAGVIVNVIMLIVGCSPKGQRVSGWDRGSQTKTKRNCNAP